MLLDKIVLDFQGYTNHNKKLNNNVIILFYILLFIKYIILCH